MLVSGFRTVLQEYLQQHPNILYRNQRQLGEGSDTEKHATPEDRSHTMLLVHAILFCKGYFSLRLITILAHAGVVTGLAGLFFGSLAWIYNSPFGLAIAGGGLVLCGAGGLLGWYYGFSPMWQPRGWEEHVTGTDQHYIVSTQQYPPYLCLQAKKRGGMQFGTGVYTLLEEEGEVAEEAQAVYGLQWRERQEAQEGHQWVVQVLSEGRLTELGGFRPISDEW